MNPRSVPLVAWVSLCSLGVATSSLLAAPFTAGNIVVSRIGNGVTTLTNTATSPMTLMEYTVTGTLSQTISLPSSGAGQQTTPGATNSNSQGNIGFYNGYLSVAGYDLPAGSARSTPTQLNQVFGTDGEVISGSRITYGDYAGYPTWDQLTKTISTSPTTFYTIGNQTRRATYFNGTGWVQLSSSGPTNNRDIGIYGGDLYVAGTATNFEGISRIGSGAPVTSGQTTELVIPSGSSTFGFVMFDKNDDGIIDLAYAGVDSGTNGGLTRWDFNDGTWGLTYNRYFNQSVVGGIGNLTTTNTDLKLRQLTGVFDAETATASLYAITSGGNLVSVTDLITGSPPTSYTQLASPGSNYVFRGVAVVPVPEPATLAMAAAGLISCAAAVRGRRRK